MLHQPVQLLVLLPLLLAVQPAEALFPAGSAGLPAFQGGGAVVACGPPCPASGSAVELSPAASTLTAATTAADRGAGWYHVQLHVFITDEFDGDAASLLQLGVTGGGGERVAAAVRGYRGEWQHLELLAGPAATEPRPVRSSTDPYFGLLQESKRGELELAPVLVAPTPAPETHCSYPRHRYCDRLPRRT